MTRDQQVAEHLEECGQKGLSLPSTDLKHQRGSGKSSTEYFFALEPSNHLIDKDNIFILIGR
jgi:hypothetical protein